jgi:hypothetical protein
MQVGWEGAEYDYEYSCDVSTNKVCECFFLHDKMRFPQEVLQVGGWQAEEQKPVVATHTHTEAKPIDDMG